MRVIVTIAAIAAMCATASAALVCGVAPDNNPFTPNNCSAFANCDAAFCACAGSLTDDNPTTCLGTIATPDCARVQECMFNFVVCVGNIANLTQSAETLCRAPAAALLEAKLMVSTDNNYTGSELDNGCRYRACFILNASSCPNGIGDAVCTRLGQGLTNGGGVINGTTTLSPGEEGSGSRSGSRSGSTGSGDNSGSTPTGGSQSGTGNGNSTRAPTDIDDNNGAAAASVFAAAGVAIAALAFAL